MRNAFATRLSQDEIDRLSAHPDVRAVVPDRLIKKPSPRAAPRPRLRAHARTVESEHASPAATTLPNGLCNTLEPEALQLTNTAFLDPSVPQAQEIVDGHGAKVTGSGVKVAILADGARPTSVAGFTRPDGSKVFIDYQNFSGDPASDAHRGRRDVRRRQLHRRTGHAERAGARLRHQHLRRAPLIRASPCNIRIRGMAPGASLVGLKVYQPRHGYATESSSWVQAVEYAVVHGGVDVINESLGSNRLARRGERALLPRQQGRGGGRGAPSWS